MEKRRVVIRSRRAGGSGASTSKSGKRAKAKVHGKEIEQDHPAWEAQRSTVAERQINYAPGKCAITADLDAGSQITTEGTDIVVVNTIGYTIRLRFRDDPLLFQKLVDALSGLEVMQDVAARIAKIDAAKKVKPEVTDDGSKPSRKIAGQMGATLSPAAKKRLQNERKGRR